MKRKQRRQAARDQKKLDEARLKLALLGEGMSAERPIKVVSASQIEPHARGMTCPVCAIGFEVLEHTARRIVVARCKQCGRTFQLHFVIERAN